MTVLNTSSRIGTLKNLDSGAKYDLLVIKYEDTYPEGKITFNVSNTPMKIAGVEKIAQHFLKTLMTTKGSDVFYPNRGTKFQQIAIMSNLSADNTVIESELRSCVTDASSQTKSALNSSSTSNANNLKDITMLGIDVTQDQVVMYVYLETLDGNTAQIAVPFPEFGITNG